MKVINLINPTTVGKMIRPTIGSTLVTCLFSLAVGSSLTACAAERIRQTLDEVKWGDAPPMLPAGAKIAVLSGNPGAEGLYTVRLKFPSVPI